MGDERGSVVAVTNSSGAALQINSYDPYGKPGGNNLGRFQYTGQQWIAEAGLYYYKARFYNADLGRFMQTDPIGYAAGMNLYAYVSGDPINKVDPTGLVDEIVVTGTRPKPRGSWHPPMSWLIDNGYLTQSLGAGINNYMAAQYGGGGAGDGGNGGGENEFRKTCFVLQGELSAGAQLGVKKARVGFGEAALFGDAGSGRLSFGTRGTNMFSTQGFRAGAVAVAPGLTSNNMVGIGIEVSREGSGSPMPRPGTVLSEQPFAVSPFDNPADSLVFGFGGAVALGVSFEVGVEFVDRGQPCPTVGGPK